MKNVRVSERSDFKPLGCNLQQFRRYHRLWAMRCVTVACGEHLPRFRISYCILPGWLLTELESRNNAHVILIYISERLTGAGAKETAIGRAGSHGRELARRHESTAVAWQR